MDKLIIATPVYRSEAAIVPECRATVHALRDAGMCVAPEWVIQPGPEVFRNRNRAIGHALRVSDWTHLLTLDADISLLDPVANIQRLLDADVDIIGGAYTMRYDDGPDMVCAARLESGHVTMSSTGRHEVDWTGGGCILIRRGCIEALGPLWFRHEFFADGSDQTTEDVGFCQHARAHGYKIWLDCDVHAVHHQLQNKGSRDMITFNAMELLALPGLFPAKGTIQDNIAVKSIREKCDLTEADLITIGFKTETVEKGTRITYQVDKAKALTRDVCFSANEIDLLKGRVAVMDEKKEITQAVLDVALKIRDVPKEQATAKEVK